MKLTCKTCLYRVTHAKGCFYYCRKRGIRIGLQHKFCELYEPK